MPRYLQPISIPNREEYEAWQRMGYTRSYEEYCAQKARHAGLAISVRGDLGSHCADCAAVGDYLCDYPVGKNVTCDRPVCGSHAHEIAPNLHYCEAHYAAWREFVDAGGVGDVLQNVIAFKDTK